MPESSDMDVSVPVRSLPFVPGKGLKWLGRLLITTRSYVWELGSCVRHYPIRDVLFGLRYEFAADRVFLYGRESLQSGLYLSDLQRQFSRFINSKPARELLEDKLLFQALAGQFVCLPRNYLYCDNKRVVVLCGEWLKIVATEHDCEPKRLVMKRSRGGGGTGIQFIEISNTGVLVDGVSMTADQFYELFALCDGSILCEFISQSQFFKQLYPNTTNSIRVICMRDSDGDPFIARAILRLGTNKSKGVDNFGRGGLAVNVDLGTGKLGAAVEHDARRPQKPFAHKNHPDTGAQILGESLPGWGEARDQSLFLMRQLPFINYVGWDIVMSEQGPVFLEGNNYTGVRLAQAHAGLLQDARVCEFYRRYGII